MGSILMVVVTINTLVTPRLPEETLLAVRSLDLLPLRELAPSEVAASSFSSRRTERLPSENASSFLQGRASSWSSLNHTRTLLLLRRLCILHCTNLELSHAKKT